MGSGGNKAFLAFQHFFGWLYGVSQQKTAYNHDAEQGDAPYQEIKGQLIPYQFKGRLLPLQQAQIKVSPAFVHHNGRYPPIFILCAAGQRKDPALCGGRRPIQRHDRLHTLFFCKLPEQKGHVGGKREPALINHVSLCVLQQGEDRVTVFVGRNDRLRAFFRILQFINHQHSKPSEKETFALPFIIHKIIA